MSFKYLLILTIFVDLFKKKSALSNATLLGSKTLALIYHYTKEIELKELAFISIKAVCNEQNIDGSFPHSDQVGQKWRDNFHTGFKLESIQFYQKYCEDKTFNLNLEKGYCYCRIVQLLLVCNLN